MSNDIKLKKLGNIDFIPVERSLCAHCEFNDECPFEYICPSLERLIKFEMENEVL